MRSVEPKRIFIVVGVVCVFLVIALYLMLDDVGLEEEQNAPNIRHIRSLRINSVTDKEISKIIHGNMRKQSIINNEKEILYRSKRHHTINPIEHETGQNTVRTKRLSEHLQHVRSQFERCRNANSEESECEKFLREMIVVSEALNHEINTMREISRNFEQSNRKNVPAFQNHGKMIQSPNTVGNPLFELNKESRLQQHADEFTTLPKIHEDLDHRQIKSWTVQETPKNDVEMAKPPFPPPMRIQSRIAISRENEKIMPLKNPNFDPSGQILQLCDQINRQGSRSEQTAQITNLPGPTSSGFVTNNPQTHNINPGFQPSFQSPQQPQVQQQPQPQPFATPPIFYRSSPVCILPQPVPQQMSMGQSLFVPQQFVGSVTSNSAANRFVLVNPNSQQFGTTSPSGQGFIQVMNQPFARSEDAASNDTYYCPYSNPDQAPPNPIKTLPTPKSSQDSSDPFYASFVNRLASINVTNPFNVCKTGEMSCTNSVQCIPNQKWCDNVKDCDDASDETSCSCPSRLNEDKLCDGYLDCPLGADEVGCFECDQHSYSCFNNNDEYQRAKLSSGGVMCYTLVQKCDGFSDCITGKDEEECSMLINQVGLHTTFMVPYTEGILYRNFHGRWYPVCDNGMDWAVEACVSEIGEISELPSIKSEIGILPGPFISKTNTDQVRFSDTCPDNSPKRSQFYLRAKCPDLKCGVTTTTTSSSFAVPRLRIRDDNERKKRNEHLRIVGGDRSGPHSWPYIVAIYKNGRFHCGGTIYTNLWIISAAHCVSKAQKHYFEVYAGMLRRFSYAPEVQISKVIKVIVNDGFDRDAMMNDVALLRLENPLLFNRWVKPICLPSADRVTSKFDPNWMYGPPPGTVCTVVGWGALMEGGISPDNLEEVKVPIMKTCKDILDVSGNEICAGYSEGGLDACQGDSGGPLVCRSSSDPNESYLAGIVSHGEGCARRNEPGVYTRVSLYVEWIDEMINSDLSVTAISTKTICPGFVCFWSSRCISQHHHCNGRIDCLGGEDELQCAYNPVGSARRRVGRQNAHLPELPEGGGHADIPHKKITTVTEKAIPLAPIQQTVESKTQEDSSHSTNLVVTTIGPEQSKAEQTITDRATIVLNAETTTVQMTPLEPEIQPIAPIPDSGPSPLDAANDDGPTKENNRRNTTLNIDNTIPTTTDELFIPEINHSNKIFECKDIVQQISLDFRCDGRIDCEDGSDEKNCSCRETLHSEKHAHLICNGITDCLDGTDEEGCLTCSANEYACRHSKKCIPKTSRCDKHADCHLNEDELDCFALTEGKTVLIDLDSRPKLSHKGIVCENVNGTWSVMCVTRRDERKEMGKIGEVCFSLGFTGYSFHNLSRVDENGEIITKRPPIQRNNFYLQHLEARRFYKRSISPKDAIIETQNQNVQFEEIVGAPQQCLALYLECVPHSVVPIIEIQPTEAPIETTTENKKTNEPSKEQHSDIIPTNPHHEETITPNAPILPNLTEAPETTNETETQIDKDFHAPWIGSVFIDGSLSCVCVLLDRSWVLVDNKCLEGVDLDHNAVVVVLGKAQNLLSVDAPFKKIHRVNCVRQMKKGPGTVMFLPNAVDLDRYTLPSYVPSSIGDEDEDCLAIAHSQSGGFISIPVFKNDTDCPNDEKNCYQTDEYLDDTECIGFDGSTSGVVVCRDKKNSTYYPISIFSNEDGLCTLNNLTQLEILEPNYNQLQILISWPICSPSKLPAHCDGYRCPLGECIPESQICDKKFDCHDGSDENTKLCELKGKCAPDELKCEAGQCISKSLFCDGKIDCPKALIIEKSDEPSECTCRHYLSLTDESKICNGIVDCFDRTDEIDCPCNGGKTCFGTYQYPFDTNYYRVKERSIGEWQSVCYRDPGKPTKDELVSLCEQLGNSNATKILYQLFHPNDESTNTLNLFATNIISTVQLNDKFNLTLFDTRHKMTEWYDKDDKTCNQLEINCGP